MKIGLKSALCGALLAAVGAFAVVQLTSALCSNAEGTLLSGRHLLTFSRGEYPGPSVPDVYYAIANVMCILQLLAGTAAVVLGVCAVFSRGAAAAGAVLASLSVLAAAFYAAFGVGMTVDFNHWNENAVWQASLPLATGVPFLWLALAAAALAGFFVLFKKLPAPPAAEREAASGGARSLAAGLAAAAMGVLTILALFAPVACLPGGHGAADTGFSLMDLQGGRFVAEEDIPVLAVAIGAFSVVQCVAASAAVIVGLLSAFFKPLREAATALCIVCLALLGLYAAFGLVYSSAVAGMSVLDPSWEGAYTLAYIPWIVGAAVVLARAAAMQWLPASSKRAARKAAEAELARVAQLERYAALHKQGLLNDEEFSAAKAKLLP